MDDNEYAALVAQHFFRQFLELKVQLQNGHLQKPRNFDKELAGYKKANDVLRKAASEMADENKKLEEQLALAEERERDLRGQLNEAILNLGRATEKLAGFGVIKQRSEKQGYPFMELLDEESRRVFEILMKEVPRPGGNDE